MHRAVRTQPALSGTSSRRRPTLGPSATHPRNVAIALGLAELDLGFDLEVIGFETPEIDLLIGHAAKGYEPDPADEVPAIDPEAPTVSRLGDLWAIGPHRGFAALGYLTERREFRSEREEMGLRLGPLGLEPPESSLLPGEVSLYDLGRYRNL